MPGTNPAPSGGDVRPLPPRPNLEFEHKRAKALLRQLRAGDPDALARARTLHPAIVASPPRAIALADAQLIAAREYGFTSWPRLVRYFETIAPDHVPHRELEDPDGLDAWVRSLLIEHRQRRISAARQLVTYAPRFYGMPVPEVFDAEVTVEDARTVVARERGYTNWEMMVADSAQPRQQHWMREPMTLVARAMKSFDLDELGRIIERHPELRKSSSVDMRQNNDIVVMAILHERDLPSNERRLTDWLTDHGFDVQRTLNRMLCGHMRISANKVRYLLDRGADADWVAPNGRSVLEHALVTYWNPEAVDVLAAHARHPSALWIAAGLGNVDAVAGFLDRDGKPTTAAYRSRPDFRVALRGAPNLPEPDDEEILVEAFMVAMLNHRTNVMEYMAKRNFPVDSLAWGSTPISFAVGNAFPGLVECLLRCGASIDIVGYRPESTPRQMARDYFQPNNPDSHRVLELCGGDPVALIAELDAMPAPEPQLTQRLKKVLEVAGDDAARCQETHITPVNILVGMLRVAHSMPIPILSVAADNGERLRTALDGRLLSGDDLVSGAPFPLAATSEACIARAFDLVRERKMEGVMPHNLLLAMLEPEDGEVAEFLASCGCDVTSLRRMLSSI
ncbi:MAG: Clp protease N-terminal domain-containing protein [Gemmatimonadota bacterium]